MEDAPKDDPAYKKASKPWFSVSVKVDPSAMDIDMQTDSNKRVERARQVEGELNAKAIKTQTKGIKRRHKQAEKRRIAKLRVEASSSSASVSAPEREHEHEHEQEEEDEFVDHVREPTSDQLADALQEAKDVSGKAIKIRLFPTTKQKEVMLYWFNASRWTYNACVAAIEEGKAKRVKKDLRAVAVNEAALNGTENEWVLDTPYNIRDSAMDDVLKAYASNFVKKAKNPSLQFDVGFRSKKALVQETVVVQAKYVTYDANRSKMSSLVIVLPHLLTSAISAYVSHRLVPS